MKPIKGTFAFVAFVLTTYPAQADNFSCRVNPSVYLGMNSSGVVYTNVEGVGVIGICSMGIQMGSINTDACKGWYSALLTYRAGGKVAWLYFDSNVSLNDGRKACTSFSQWDIREPYYLESAVQ